MMVDRGGTAKRKSGDWPGENDMAKKVCAARKRLLVEFRRGGRMTDEDYRKAMAVDESVPLFRGVLELLDRAEDQIWDQNRDAELSRDARADLGLQAGVVRELRSQLLQARESAANIRG